MKVAEPDEAERCIKQLAMYGRSDGVCTDHPQVAARNDDLVHSSAQTPISSVALTGKNKSTIRRERGVKRNGCACVRSLYLARSRRQNAAVTSAAYFDRVLAPSYGEEYGS